jgi:dTDP-4-amino-4,6-dideoxygalactose transaminase
MSRNIRIPQTDPRAGYLAHRTDIDEAMRRVMEAGRYILGPEVEAFEQEFARYVGAPFAVATGNGTDALHLALRSLDIGRGDFVLTVSHTAVATAAAIVQCGACPVFVDIEPSSFTMEPSRLDDAIRRYRTRPELRRQGQLKAVVPVHLYGQAADMPTICEIARKHGLFVVEDCAQSHGATIGGKHTGTWGDLAAFSFYPTKNLGAFGDGGMIVTGQSDLAAKARGLREYGWDRNRISQSHGINSRLDELQAAVLRVKLRHLDADNDRRTAIAATYDKLLSKDHLVPPVARPGTRHAYHQYVIRSPRRDELRDRLHGHDVETAVHYPLAVHQHPAFRDSSGESENLVETERAVAEVLSLPMYSQLDLVEAKSLARLVNRMAAKPPI